MNKGGHWVPRQIRPRLARKVNHVISPADGVNFPRICPKTAHCQFIEKFRQSRRDEHCRLNRFLQRHQGSSRRPRSSCQKDGNATLPLITFPKSSHVRLQSRIPKLIQNMSQFSSGRPNVASQYIRKRFPEGEIDFRTFLDIYGIRRAVRVDLQSNDCCTSQKHLHIFQSNKDN